jgi:hypothetical protein
VQRASGLAQTGPRQARPDDRLPRNPPLPEGKDGGLRFRRTSLKYQHFLSYSRTTHDLSHGEKRAGSNRWGGESAYTDAMEIKKPVAATVLLAFVTYTTDQMRGGMLFIDAPPGAMLGAAVASSSAHAVNYIFQDTTTDRLIEAPAPDPDRPGQS